jgi:hypothetical protein
MLKIELSENEAHLVIQGLDLLKTAKLDNSRLVDGIFTQNDFGIPAITALMNRIDQADTLDEEVQP